MPHNRNKNKMKQQKQNQEKESEEIIYLDVFEDKFVHIKIQSKKEEIQKKWEK